MLLNVDFLDVFVDVKHNYPLYIFSHWILYRIPFPWILCSSLQNEMFPCIVNRMRIHAEHNKIIHSNATQKELKCSKLQSKCTLKVKIVDDTSLNQIWSSQSNWIKANLWSYLPLELTCVLICREHTNFVNCVRFSPDGSKFITVGSDKKGIIYEGKTGEKIGELSAQDGHQGSIYAVSWSPDGKQVTTLYKWWTTCVSNFQCMPYQLPIC